MHKRVLFLQQVRDHLAAVFAEVREHKADMHPIGARRVVLPNQLIELEMVFDVIEYPFSECHIAVDTDVCGLTLQVLRVAHTSHGCIQFLTPVAAADLDWSVHRHAQRLQHVGREVHEVDHFLRGWFVVNAVRLGIVAGIEFFYCEVHGDGGVHLINCFRVLCRIAFAALVALCLRVFLSQCAEGRRQELNYRHQSASPSCR